MFIIKKESKVKGLLFFLIAIALIIGKNEVVKAESASNIQQCQIDGEGQKVCIQAEVNDIYASDGMLYLYALAVYDNDLIDDAPIAAVSYTGNGNYSFTVPLNYNSEQSLLYKKFVLVTNQDGFFRVVSDYHYITNPEVMAENTSPKYVGATKKGISATVSDMKELNADNGLLEITLEEFLTVPEGGRTVDHTYDGFTVHLNRGMVDYYDMIIREMWANGMAVNVGITGASTTSIPELIYPGVDYEVETDNYGLNTGNEIGLKYVAAVIDFLAERYSSPDSANGCVSNWLIGNEVNDEKTFYYIGANGIDDFVEKYMQTFRVAYNIIRSHYANSDIFMRMANLWYVVQDTDNFAGKKYLEKFNELARRQGNFDWSVSYHPYSCPLTDADVLDDGKVIVRDYFCKYIGYAEHNFTTFEITMYNIDVLVDFLKQAQFLNQNGEMRTINLSEQGYTSETDEGEDQQTIQAASMIYAYYKALAMPEIESVFFYRYQDNQKILDKYPYWKFGLKDVSGNKRYAYDIYKYLNTSKSLQVTDFAKKIYGISSWSELIPDFDESLLAGFKDYSEKNSIYTVTGFLNDNILVSDMNNAWTDISNIRWFSTNNVGQNWHSTAVNKRGWACSYNEGSAHEYMAVKHIFEKSIDLTAFPYLAMDFEVDLDSFNKEQQIEEAEVLIRLTSNGNCFDASGVVEVGQIDQYFTKSYTLCIDVSDWEYKNQIDSIEIWVNQMNSEDRMAAELMVYDVRYSNQAEGMQVLPKAFADKKDLSDAWITMAGTYPCTGLDVRPEVTVLYENRILVNGIDYRVNYYNNVQSGTAKAIIYGVNAYDGCKVVEFTLVAPTPVYNGVNYSAVYNADDYYNSNPDIAVEVGYDYQKLLEHFVNFGMAEGRCAKKDFNVLYYKYSLGNEDLRNAYGGDLIQYYYHYINNGIYEGRSVSDWDAVFDTEYYLNCYPEVYHLIVSQHSEYSNVNGYALWHFYEYGLNEGRKGREDFGVFNYEAANPDVWRAYGRDYKQAAIHYLQYGTGRNTSAQVDIYNFAQNHQDVVAAYGTDCQAWISWYDTYRDYIYNEVDYSGVYDPYDYIRYNCDVEAAFGENKDKLLWHFVNFGMREGRYARTGFNVLQYMYGLLNDDLRNTYGGDLTQYYYHYMNYGRFEGRSVSDYHNIFNAEYYLQEYPDVKQVLIDKYTSDGNLAGWALWHYYEFGMNEGRKPNQGFCILNYLGANPDIFAVYGKDYRAATIHYMCYGIGENRQTYAKIDISNLQLLRPDVVEALGTDSWHWVNWYIYYGKYEY